MTAVMAIDQRTRDELKAALALHDADAWPDEDPEHTAAEAALDALLGKSGGWDGLDRNGRRLASHLAAKSDATAVDLVAHARGLGLLPTTPKE